MSGTFDHLVAMSDATGLFEHAAGTEARIEHGYCTDDNARLLVVTSREPDDGPTATLSRLALEFTLAAQTPEGLTRNRMSFTGHWTDHPTTEDCWGRSLWALGVAATHHDDEAVRTRALGAFRRGAVQRSRWPRAMAFAALGAADVAARHADDTVSRDLLRHALETIGGPRGGTWLWPEDRLRYANATLAEAVIAAGGALNEPAVLDRGLSMLGWLLDRETASGHLSVVGTEGADATTRGPQFDQQPIEVAAMADACWRAYTLTGQRRWIDGLVRAAQWFDGANDTRMVMHDPESGGGYDGLTEHGVNTNQGAESTLAYVSTMQRACTVPGGVR